jgi:hypothetical protein
MPEDEDVLPEHVEGPGPSFRVVAVCVPHFDRQTGSYQGEHKDTYVLGFELTAGSFDVSTLRTDPRFAHDPRLIIYESTTTFIQRFDLESRQSSAIFVMLSKGFLPEMLHIYESVQRDRRDSFGQTAQ